jgi:hypothetical protein
MITTHPALSNVRITTFKSIKFVLGMRNKWILNITTKHYDSVSFHDGVVDIIPYFFIVANNEMHGITTTIAY